MRKSRAKLKEDRFYSKEELEELDTKGPEPVSAHHRQKIIRAAYETYHQPAVPCAVCDQFCQKDDCDEYLPFELPDTLFTALILHVKQPLCLMACVRSITYQICFQSQPRLTKTRLYLQVWILVPDVQRRNVLPATARESSNVM